MLVPGFHDGRVYVTAHATDFSHGRIRVRASRMLDLLWCAPPCMHTGLSTDVPFKFTIHRMDTAELYYNICAYGLFDNRSCATNRLKHYREYGGGGSFSSELAKLTSRTGIAEDGFQVREIRVWLLPSLSRVDTTDGRLLAVEVRRPPFAGTSKPSLDERVDVDAHRTQGQSG